MTATITPTAKHTGANITRPVDGEGAYMDGGTAPIGPILQTLADRAQYARGAGWGARHGGDEFSVDSGGTSTVFAVRVNAFEAITVSDTSNVFWPLYTAADTVWTLADVEGSPANLSNNTWYYCYLGVTTAGVLTRQISTTAPNGSRTWKSTAIDQQRYIGCFRTTGAGAPIPVRAVRGRYLYRYSAAGGHGTAAASYLTTQAFTDLDLSAYLPLHARIAHMHYQLINEDTTSGDEVASAIRTNGETTSSISVQVPHAQAAGLDNASREHMFFEIETDSSQRVEVEVTGSSTSFLVNLFVRGFSE